MSQPFTRAARARHLVSRILRLPHPELVRLSPEDRRYLTTPYDDSVPLPEGAAAELRADNPRLLELRERYARMDPAIRTASRWNSGEVRAFVDLRHFRGESLFVWHYRELRRVTELKYYVWLRHLRDRDHLGLLDRLDEDGAFGCWTFGYADSQRVSRDLLESVNEIAMLDRELGIAGRDALSVLDVGAGYGRLAHRMTQALPNLHDYCCVDAVPEATFLSEWYLRFRGCTPPARVLALDEVDGLEAGRFDLALNVHSFSECPLAAIAWWFERIAPLRIPHLLIVPNEPDRLLSLEPDGSRRDFAPLVERAGYRPAGIRPAIDDPAVRDLLRVEDHFHLFELHAPQA